MSTEIERNLPHAVQLGKSGPVVVMLHGWGHSIQNLRPLGELLSWNSRVHLLDLPGFGDSPAPSEPWDTQDYATEVLRYLDTQGLSQVDLVGHSFGGRIAIRLAAAHPGRVRKLILINSHGLKIEPPLRKKLRIRYLATLRWLIRKFDLVSGAHTYETFYIPRYASRDYKAAGALRQTFLRVINEDLTAQAAQINAETLLMWGERDQETPLAIGKKLKALIRRSRLLVFPGRGHEPFNGGGAHLCAYHIQPFLADRPAREDVVSISS